MIAYIVVFLVAARAIRLDLSALKGARRRANAVAKPEATP